MQNQLSDLRTRLEEVNDLQSAAALLAWDQTTYMPPGGADARGRQLAILSRLAHEKMSDPAIGSLLDTLRPYEESLPPDSEAGSLLRVTRRDYDRIVKVPSSFTAEFSQHTALAYQAWAEARPANDFAAMVPLLERTLELNRQYAEYFPGYAHIADPLIHTADEGMTVASVRALFSQLRTELGPIVRAIAAQPAADDTCLKQVFPEAQQLEFGLEIIRRFGYDLNRGRQDKTHHPYMTKFSLGDVRITTRVKENDLGDALFSTMHEAGHAVYEQGIRHTLEGTPLAGGTSAGVHESQSRLWENLVGRSRGFWSHWYPRLQAVFPEQLGSVPFDVFYRAINKVEPSLIRTDADEVTYNPHVMLRFDLEIEMLEGRLAVRDLPEAWRERYKADLGIAPPDDRDGVLQDVHWFSDFIGGVFQGYTLGNIMSAQFFDAALSAHPEIRHEIAAGEYGTLHNWLKDNIYQYGRSCQAAELVERATGGPISIEPYMRYLRTKFGELYTL